MLNEMDLPCNVLVVGLMRSGLTATCHLLAAGGAKVAGGWPDYEPYPIGGTPWGSINGQVVKLVDTHNHFPPLGTYAVIRLRRDLAIQAQSFNRFTAEVYGAPGALCVDTKRLIASFQRDYQRIDRWAEKQRQKITIDFGRLVAQPKATAERLASFLGIELDIEKAAAAIVERTEQLYPTLLERDFVKSQDRGP